MRVKVYYSESLSLYSFGSSHPFGPHRLSSFWQETVKQGLDKRITIGQPVLCTEESLSEFHTREYIHKVKEFSKTGRGFLDQGDTPAFKGMFEATSYVVGAGLDGLEQILSGEFPHVFIPIAGLHHARRNSAAGFCVFNDPGVLIETLRKKYSIKRVAYVDMDAHHGDGVFYAFEEDPDLIFADIHEDGRYLYPGTGYAEETGKGPARGTKLNIPMPPGSDDDAFYKVWPELEEFVRAGKPEIILLQAGADSVSGDPITHMRFSPKAYFHAAKRLCAVAEKYCQGRIIGLGGGGYNLSNLALAWNAVVEGMLE